MNVKQIIPGMAVVAASALLLAGCGKTRMISAPKADTDLQSSVDASFALFRITDVEMMSAFVSDNSFPPKFYDDAPGSSDQIQAINNVDADYITVAYAIDGTNSLDGVHRQGSVITDRSIDIHYSPLANPNSHYYRRAGYVGKLTLNNYLANGWSVNTETSDPCIILNQLKSDNFDRQANKLSWSINGSFKFEKDGKILHCTVDLVKTLVNTSDPAVFPLAPTASINWPLATVAYTGKMTGIGFDGTPFTMTINADQPILRDFTCSPEEVSNVTSQGNTLVTQKSEFHPFKDGTAYLTLGTSYQREIYYGGSEAAGKGQCDNSGSIVIKGISYPVDFQK